MQEIIRDYQVESPASEAELGKELRERALASRILEIIALDQEGERQVQRLFSMKIGSIALQSTRHMPYLTGEMVESIGGTDFAAGIGRLTVIGSPEVPESERTLRLSVVTTPRDGEDDTLDELDL